MTAPEKPIHKMDLWLPPGHPWLPAGGRLLVQRYADGRETRDHVDADGVPIND